MQYIDGFVFAVPDANRDAFVRHASESARLLREHGALRVCECWGDDVPEGKLTSFPMAVKREPGETVVFAWVAWPDKATRDAAWPKIEADSRMRPDANPAPFDGKRMIYGGFLMVVDG